jgi:hypothetical protein
MSTNFKKDFVHLATLVQAMDSELTTENDGVPPRGWDVTLGTFITRLANWFASTNKNFDEKQFRAAATPEWMRRQR